MAGVVESAKDNANSEPALEKLESREEHGEDLKDLASFKVDRVISCDSRHKNIAVLGTALDSNQRTIIFLEKKPFDAESFDKLCTHDTVFEKLFRNDVYGNYDCHLSRNLNGVKATVISPASDKHIQKYESQPIHIVEETPELYHTVTLPHVEKEQLNLQWVYNILEHKSEVDRIVLEDSDPRTGFVLIPDLKWDGIDIKCLYLLALVRQTGIKSLRDLTVENLPLLKNILIKCTNVIKEKYGLPASRIRAFLHYQPTFYHLHIHFTYVQYDAPGIHTERAHMLTTVINNLELLGTYYQTATLPFSVKQTDKLFEIFREKGIIQDGPASTD